MLPTTLERFPDGRTLRLARIGEGDPVVLLHGYPENLQIWSRLAPLLASRSQVIAFDWPGMGYSSAWPGDATPHHKADRLAAILDHLGISRATIVGMDMGGPPALVFAARYPERTSRLVVMNSLVWPDARTSWEIHLIRHFDRRSLILRYLPRVVFMRGERTFLPPGIRLPSALRDDFLGAFRRREVREFIARMCTGYQQALPGLPQLYARITAPTLVLWGARDRHFPMEHARNLAATIPQARLQCIPNGEHWMAWQCAEEIGEMIGRF